MLYVYGIAVLVMSACAYCLVTGLGPFTRRHWADRAWRVMVAVVCAYLTAAFFFGDS